MALQLVWFRTDLRTFDHSALASAAEKGPVVAVFLRSVEQWREHGHGANKIDFWHRSVRALKESLNALNIPLLHRDIGRYDEAAEALLEIAREHGIERLHFNRQYPLNEHRRDAQVLEAFKHEGIPAHSYHDAVAFAPGTLLTGKNEYYSVFTPFSKAWHKNLKDSQLHVLDAPKKQAALSIGNNAIPALPELDQTPVNQTAWPPGEDAASDALARFLQKRAKRYNEQRDFPAVAGTSELSPYLALGVLSYRQCMQAVMSHNGGHLADGDKGLTTWVNELVWREFYQHVAYGFPRVVRHEPFQEHTKALEWRDDDEGFKAWCEGRTGYPIVDAAMRQLVNTGWMHNRLRMVTAMFLSKHLLIDWRRGERFFLEHLVDGEFCSNNGGWQWAASTGTDAAPYFRIFNPTTQSTRFDPDGEFIAEWLPELSELPAKARHAPPSDMLTKLDYPEPIVDHKAARQRALEAFKAL
ncbi:MULTISPECIES: deoxyribodipyrimidine photo-lyase [unclassified Halomonas]|uniref:deoxyribodipyrimidine photo-lyase n=1 Tax=unclassified Halomonas TaxID=2609666 RepID=UPI0021E37F13|nr:MULTISPECIES: deoxyribodipyrimidine photo-lyase [unclassified Halomonas]UYG00100.1 deoxyribodipyrimidine photo-lyase [Halomonas sp. GD1P12]WNL42150.1 deoxyribodipyrimidine photo-lyase [Halomonas sp. PAMB 3264]